MKVEVRLLENRLEQWEEVKEEGVGTVSVHDALYENVLIKPTILYNEYKSNQYLKIFKILLFF